MEGLLRELLTISEIQETANRVEQGGCPVAMTGLSSVHRSQVAAALPHFQQVYAVQPVWRELLPRMAGAGLLPADAALLDQLGAV